MVTDTCKSLITYKVAEDTLVEPFRTQRIQKASAMFDENKCEFFPNGWSDEPGGCVQKRRWIDHAAAQEFIDYITPLAESYGIEISTTIEDLEVDNKP